MSVAAGPRLRIGSGGNPVRAVVAPVLLGVAFLAVWEAVVRVGDLPPYLLPAPSAIAGQVGENLGDIAETFAVSGANAVIGLVVGALLGIAVGGLAARSSLLDELVSPLAAALAAMPVVAMSPVLNTMFSSTSSVPRRVVVAAVAFFPVFVNTVRGMRQVEPVHLELMRSYDARGFAVVRVLRWPGALPFVFTGLRVAASLAVISAIVAEYFGGLQNGLGSRITSAASNTAYARAWSYVVAAIVLGLVFYVVALAAERYAMRGRAPLDL